MINSPLVSVIMPVYNTELYVTDAINSILRQTLDSLELICVDDGSTDHSRSICNEFAANDERVTVILQENSGQGRARNIALDLARGRFVYFMDSDDVLSLEALETICLKMVEADLDLMFFEAHSFGDVKGPTVYKRRCSYDKVYSGTELAGLLLSNDDFIVSPCLYVARTELYRTKDIKFLDEHVKHEDDIFTILALLHARRATCLRRDLYARRCRSGSTMTSFDPVSSTKGAFWTYSELLRRREASSADSPLRSSAADEFLSRCKSETVRHFSHCAVPLNHFAEMVECRDVIEHRAAAEVLETINDMGIRFSVERFLRLMKRKLIKRLGQ